MVPFAHLSAFLAGSSQSRRLIGSMCKRLGAKGVHVDTLSFGYHKDFEMVLSELAIAGHPGSVGFRRVPRSYEADLLLAAKAVGIERARGLLARRGSRE